MTDATVSSITPKAIINICANRGIKASALLHHSGISSKQLETTGERVSITQVFKLWSAAKTQTGDELISLRTAESMPFGAFKLIDYLIMTSSTLNEGLNKIIRYYKLLNDGFEVRLQTQKDRFYIELISPFQPGELSAKYIEFVLTSFLVRLRISTGLHCNPLEVSFTHPTPQDFSKYNQAFKSIVKFNQKINCLVLQRDLLNFKHPQADPELCEIMEHHAQKLLNRNTQPDGFINELQGVINQGFRFGDVSLNYVSRKLAMSRRAVQRKLNSHGTSYRNLLDERRMELSIGLLKNNSAKIEEIASFLVFSDSTSFYKAFKKWTGKSPQEYLKNQN